MISVAESMQAVVARTPRLESKRVALDAALGRVLREDARADLDSPPFDASAMDGYAVRRGDLPGRLAIVGAAPAGEAFGGVVGPGQAVRILTGAPVPAGADWVVKQEEVGRDADFVRVAAANGPGFIRRRGENRRQGDVVVPAGTRLGPPELAALVAAGVERPLVSPAPRCAHLVTGRELVAPGCTPSGAQIRDTNSILVASLLRRHGADLVGQCRVRDDVAAAHAAVAAMAPHDVLLISGGASHGDHDIARALLEALGFTLHFGEVNLRPGRPLVFASRQDQLAFALPGNPVSHWVVFQLFVAPLLSQLETGQATGLRRLSGRCAAGGGWPPPDPRPTFWPCSAALVDGTYELTLLPLASSGDSSGLVGANALVPLPAPPARLDASQPVEFIPCP